MGTKIDHTAAIFAALGVTRKIHSWAYVSWLPEMPTTPDRPISLLSGTLESDGLAVRLVEIAMNKYLIQPPTKHHRGDWIIFSYSKLDSWHSVTEPVFAHAVHDALVQALRITDKEKPE